jgi:hypothetical protein
LQAVCLCPKETVARESNAIARLLGQNRVFFNIIFLSCMPYVTYCTGTGTDSTGITVPVYPNAKRNILGQKFDKRKKNIRPTVPMLQNVLRPTSVN